MRRSDFPLRVIGAEPLDLSQQLGVVLEKRDGTRIVVRLSLAQIAELGTVLNGELT